MTDQPLGIADLIHKTQALIERPKNDYWFWCRKHERAEHASQPTTGLDPDHPGYDTSAGHFSALRDCVRVGPFMSESEANRLKGRTYAEAHHGFTPLGMEVEK